MTENTPTEKTTPEAAVTRDEAVRAAHSKATSDLRNKHRDEFNASVKKYAAEAGFEWSPKKTQEEKDREAFEALLAARPEFRDLV
jgi:hypothetical protein